jgi:hypothetical protein
MMPFAFLIAGAVLIDAGFRGTASQMFSLLYGEFTGSNSGGHQGGRGYFAWFLAIFLIGAVGYIPDLKPISTGFLVLVILVLFLKSANGGAFFSDIDQDLGITKAAGGSQ